MIINNAVLTGSFIVNGVNYITNTPTTGSNTFVGTQTTSGSVIITGSLQVTGSIATTGTITAQTLVVQTVTSSIVYSSGSNIFGNSLTDTQKMTGSLRVTGSGNHYILGGYVGINNTNPASRLYVQTTAGATKAYDDTTKTNIMCFDDTSMVAGVGGSITFGGYKTAQTNGGNFAAIDGVKENGTAGNEAGAFRIWTANSSGVFGERMRLTSGGNVLIGTTTDSVGKLQIRTAGSDAIHVYQTSAGGYGLAIDTVSNGGIYYFAAWVAGSTDVGGITSNGTTTTYATTSDYRIKEDFKVSKGLEKVSAINVYDFKYKDSDNRMDGVVAHELQDIIPYAVVGEKDGERMQGVDYSLIVPTLIKAIQELKAENDILKERLTALENK